MAHSDFPPAAACPGLNKLQVETLEESCRKAKEKAYCRSHTTLPKLFWRSCINSLPGPYSKFRVGCAILVQPKYDSGSASSTLDGTVITGANVENAAYPVGTCAERVAIGWAVAQGYRAGDIVAVAVSTDLDEQASPCGMCRQFINEFCDGSVPVLMFNRVGAVKVLKVEEVCCSIRDI
jgi:cytidine deaminase